MEFGASKLLGAYEFYYSAGFLYGKLGVGAPSEVPGAEDIVSELEKRQGDIGSGDKRLEYLINAVAEYPVEGIDEQKDKEGISSLFTEGMSDGQNYG